MEFISSQVASGQDFQHRRTRSHVSTFRARIVVVLWDWRKCPNLGCPIYDCPDARGLSLLKTNPFLSRDLYLTKGYSSPRYRVRLCALVVVEFIGRPDFCLIQRNKKATHLSLAQGMWLLRPRWPPQSPHTELRVCSRLGTRRAEALLSAHTAFMHLEIYLWPEKDQETVGANDAFG